MNLLDLYAKISLDTSEYDSGVNKVSKSGSSLGSKLKSGLATAGNIAAKGIGLIAGAATAAGGALLALEASTEEYRIAQGKLNTAFEAAGYSAETAKEVYTDFYEILGDTDTATEASQLLAKLSDSQQDLTKWTRIAAGVNGTFGDSLPIEGLIESANETARVGQVTGNLADALNWVSINEDEFNALLAECSDESERNQLILETLSAAYDDASDAFYKNNKVLTESRKAQAKMQDALADLGETISDVKNEIIKDFAPAIADLTTSFSGIITGAKNAEKDFSAAIKSLIKTASSKLPEFLSFGTQIIVNIAQGLIESVPELLVAAGTAVAQLVQELGKALPELLQSGMNMLAELARGIEQGLPDFVSKLPIIIENFLGYITENLPIILEQGVQIINSLVNGILQAIPELVRALPDIILAITDFITENLPQMVAAGISLIVNLAAGILQAIPELIAAIPEVIGKLISGIQERFPDMVECGKEVLGQIKQGIQDFIPIFVEVAPEIVNSLGDAIKASQETVRSFGVWLLETIKTGITETIPNFVESIPGVIEAIGEKIGSLRETIVEIGTRILLYIITGFKNGFPDLREAVPGAVDAIRQGFMDAGSSYFSIGKNIITGIANGITSSWGWLKNQVVAIANSLVTAAKSALGIHSPSTVFASIGQYMAEGLGVGWDQQFSSIRDGIENDLDFGNVKASVNTEATSDEDKSNAFSDLLVLAQEKLLQYAQLFETYQDLGSNYVISGLQSLRQRANSEANKMIVEARQIYTTGGKNIGLAFANAVAEGLLSGTGRTVNAAVQMATQVLNATKETLGVDSYSSAVASSYQTYSASPATYSAAGNTTVNQYIQTVPMTPSELARQSADAFNRLRWA